MKQYSSFFFLLIVTLLTGNTNAQILKSPATWNFRLNKSEAKVGDIVEVRMTAAIDDGWYMYSSDFDPNLGPNLAVSKFKPNNTYELVGKLTPVGAKEKYEEVWGGNVRYFTHEAIFTQKVKILKNAPTIAGSIEYSTCSLKDGTCLPPAESDFSLTLKTTEATASAATPSPTAVATSQPASGSSVAEAAPTSQTATSTAVAPSANQTLVDSEQVATASSDEMTPREVIAQPEQTADTSLIGFIVAAFLSGLLALLTPCVFPIIPMTVSYFTKQNHGFAKALLYGVSIIGIYVLIGTLVSRINGPAFANFVSTHWIPNLLFFAIFFVFGLSFLGLFEIVLPSSLVNKADAQAEKGGVLGIIFMAFTLVLVSFSCTGPIVGSLLVASAGGEIVKPIVGMAAFSSAFAIPFTLFAAFPQWLKSLPKSGGWLNSVKVVLGFLELALALKFFSIADQVYHWNLLDREIYLALWVVIFSLIGFYLLGKIRLPHDSETKTVSVPRLLLAIVTFAFVVYMIPGLWGAPLKALAGYLPPETTQDFGFTARSESASKSVNALGEQPKHADLFRLPHGIQGFFDYNEALAYAKKVNKPVFIDFTGHGCVNCREMESRVWSESPVLQRLTDDYVVVALYVDDKTELPQNQWYSSKYDGKQKKTIGGQNADLQIVKYKNNAQPHYCLVDNNGNLLVQPKNYDLDVNNFAAFLDEGKKAYQTAGMLSNR
ncbi:protein-disulfide reductase DsbD family protein [Tellurirhabdus bombi]|uniref:protein-disulfide reductase DsbD family protein n=1 Tax=Tellurirhabdus bombi TaxID=2907205 RepID=UPI001F2B0619|nr:cytochrome c biogenesis protein CcdA [Tellurirhabdus bombi]